MFVCKNVTLGSLPTEILINSVQSLSVYPSVAVASSPLVLAVACAGSMGGDSMLVYPATLSLPVGATNASLSITGATMAMPTLHCTLTYSAGDARFAAASATTNVFSVVASYTVQSSSSTGGSTPATSTGMPSSAVMAASSGVVAVASMLFALVALLL